MKNCSGRDCPIKDECERYIKRPSQREKWNTEDYKYDYKNDECSHVVWKEYKEFPDFLDHDL